MARRSKAREVVLQMLFQIDLNDRVQGGAIREMIDEQLSQDDLRAFAWDLFSGTMEFRAAIDEQIEKTAKNWTLARMAPTDRNVLRLGGYELLHTATPPGVVIDEAVELAKKFGGTNSPQFVNGILDRMKPGVAVEGESESDAASDADAEGERG